MRDKRISELDVVSQIEDGMTIGIGGWASRRKPMSLVRAIANSDLRDLTIVSYAGPDVGILCAAGKVRRVVYGFASLDTVPLEPWFRHARQTGQIAATELDEGMLWIGLQAAARRLPFQVSRAGLGSDVMTVNPELRTVRSPYEDAEELVAVPAINLDVALVHMNRSDAAGNSIYLGPDPYFDDLFAGAATRCFVSCEQVVATEQLSQMAPPQAMLLSRMNVSGVIEAPLGAHFTSCPGDYERDEQQQASYVAAAKDPQAWSAFAQRYVYVSHDAYRQSVTQ